MSVTQVVNFPKVIQQLAKNCPECASKNLIHAVDTCKTICGDCGLVLYLQMLDKVPEWRSFTQQEKLKSYIPRGDLL